jgi:hypothetical protein
VRSFGGQERFNAVDITKWRIALTLKVEWFRAGEEQVWSLWTTMIQAGQHSDKLPSLLLPRRDQALLYSHVDAIFSKLETLKIHKGIIALHNGVRIGQRKHEGCQAVPACTCCPISINTLSWF